MLTDKEDANSLTAFISEVMKHSPSLTQGWMLETDVRNSDIDIERTAAQRTPLQ